MAINLGTRECPGNTTREYERFFPVFRTDSLGYDQRSIESRSPIASDKELHPNSFEISLSEDSMFVPNTDTPATSLEDERTSGIDKLIKSSSAKSKKVPKNNYQGRVAQALGLSLTEKVFNFNNEAERKKRKYGITKMLKFAPKGYADDIINSENEGISSMKKDKQPENTAPTLKAETFVQAPGLRNDFYSSLISWSHAENKIAVGLNVFTYMWNLESFDVNPILVEEYETVTCVCCSLNDLLAIGTISGRIMIVSQSDKFKVKATYLSKARNIHAIAWFKDGKRFLVSDHSGTVQLLAINKTPADQYRIELEYTFSCHQQLVCGITLNLDETQAAFGSNDNTVSIWDIKDLQGPKLKFILPHSAAIKAIAFCPWSKSLLATGGGTKDRTIRFWHSCTGTLIKSFFTNSQITSLTWSKTTKEIVATFGFGETKVLLTVYSYPDMKPLSQAASPVELRILSATISPDGNSLCVATNDSTIRIYKLWNHNLQNGVPQVSGIFESSLLELFEGADKPFAPIR